MVDVETKDAGSRVGRAAAKGLLVVVLAVLVALVAVLALFLWWSHDVSTPDDGDPYAAELAERTAIGIADDIEGTYAEPLDAENLATTAVADPRLAGGDDATYEIQVLGWRGASGQTGGARVDLSISVDVAGRSSGAIFGDSRTAGHATSCWSLVVRAHEHDDTADLTELDCPADATPVTPAPTPLPSLGPDAEEVLLGAVDRLPDGASAAEAEQSLRAEFPDFVDVRAERSGAELVATAGVVRSRDCVVAVRPDGEPSWRFSDFRRIQLEPGESGCTPGLYLRPVTTH